MKTAELMPPLLDDWVARALGAKDDAASADWHWTVDVGGPTQRLEFHSCPKEAWWPSTDPGLGQPIIERDKIGVEYGPHNMLPGAVWDRDLGPWHGYLQRPDGGRSFAFGPTPLIAAMRAKVASVYGEEVPDEAAP